MPYELFELLENIASGKKKEKWLYLNDELQVDLHNLVKLHFFQKSNSKDFRVSSYYGLKIEPKLEDSFQVISFTSLSDLILFNCINGSIVYLSSRSTVVSEDSFVTISPSIDEFTSSLISQQQMDELFSSNQKFQDMLANVEKERLNDPA